MFARKPVSSHGFIVSTFARLLFWLVGRFAVGWRASWSAACKLAISRDSENLVFVKRFRMSGQFLAKSGDLLSRDGAGIVAPFAPFVSEDVGDFLVSQRFVPWLHHGGPVWLAFHCDRALQTL